MMISDDDVEWVVADLAELERRLARLEDRAELSDLVVSYGQRVDDRDLDALRQLYTEDAVFDSTKGPVSGREKVLQYYGDQLASYGPTFHYTHGQTVEFTGPDTATGVVHAHAELAMPNGGFLVAIRYLDDYRREDGRWRFHRRRARQLYGMPMTDVPGYLGQRLRKRWPERDPAEADIPESLPTYRDFFATR